MKIVQRMLPSLLAAAILFTAVVVRSHAADEELDTAPAMAASESWLHTVDAGGYARSWDQASKLFREKVTKDKWESLVQPVREQTGNLVARKVRSARYTRELPNAPAGEYVVIQYDARFERIPHAVETVTPMKDPDGTWRVAGYVVAPM